MTADSPRRWSLAVQTAVVTTTVAVVAVVMTQSFPPDFTLSTEIKKAVYAAMTVEK